MFDAGMEMDAENIKCSSPQKVKLEVKTYKCEFCGISCLTNRKLEIHYKERHICEIDWYYCKKCGKTFRNEEKLCVHLQTHRKKKSFECKVCKKQLSIKYNLQSHMAGHIPELGEYSCNKCPKVFSQRSTYRNHMNIHDKVYQRSVPRCEKVLSSANSLIIHLKKCTGFDDFPCVVCKKPYYAKERLKQHEQSATHQFTLVEIFEATRFHRK